MEGKSLDLYEQMDILNYWIHVFGHPCRRVASESEDKAEEHAGRDEFPIWRKKKKILSLQKMARGARKRSNGKMDICLMDGVCRNS